MQNWSTDIFRHSIKQFNSFLTFEYHFYNGRVTKQSSYFNLDARYWKTSVTQSIHDSKNGFRSMQGNPALHLNKLRNNTVWKTRNNEEKSNTKSKNCQVLAPFFWPSGLYCEVMLLFSAFASIARIVFASFMILSASAG